MGNTTLNSLYPLPRAYEYNAPPLQVLSHQKQQYLHSENFQGARQYNLYVYKKFLLLHYHPTVRQQSVSFEHLLFA